MSVDAVEARLEAGEGTLLLDERYGFWWWSPERVEVPTRTFGPARTREEAEEIVGDVAVMRATRERWCTE
ncbi:MAG: hypothetical protein K2Q20_04525, partial [Phycisphaerales bacterium]|nr:hypothetical protein [Phycisphaerales bacterium]